MAATFLSYCSADRDIARKLVDSFTAEGISVWWDDRLTPVDQWDRLIEKEIRAASTVLVLWTPRATEGDWVRVEANFGLQRKKLSALIGEAGSPDFADRALARFRVRNRALDS